MGGAVLASSGPAKALAQLWQCEHVDTHNVLWIYVKISRMSRYMSLEVGCCKSLRRVYLAQSVSAYPFDFCDFITITDASL